MGEQQVVFAVLKTSGKIIDGIQVSVEAKIQGSNPVPQIKTGTHFKR